MKGSRTHAHSAVFISYNEALEALREDTSSPSRSSGPESFILGSMLASWCARGFAQYILNVRAAGLSGPAVWQDASQAFLTHAFASVKSDTCSVAV